MKPLLTTDKLVEIYMPNGDCGLFELLPEKQEIYMPNGGCELEKQRIKKFDDYVLKVLSLYNYVEKKSYEEKDATDITVGLLFETLSNRIAMRTMFMKLYYRCFRLAFRPGNNQARALAEENQALAEEIADLQKKQDDAGGAASTHFATFVEECAQ